MNVIEFLRSRHSIRSYTSTSVSDEIRNKLQASVTMINTHEAGIHFELHWNDPKPFEGFKASYGMFKGVQNYLACIVDLSFPHVYERAGFFAQQFVMDAVKLGLGTCFVGGTYSPNMIKTYLRVDWKILFVVTIGYPSEKAQTFLSGLTMKYAHRKNRQINDFFVETNQISYSDAKEKMPWLEIGLTALACAPSALNKQPVRITPIVHPEYTIKAFVEEESPNALIDLGIGKYNFSLAANGEWEWGNGGLFFHNCD